VENDFDGGKAARAAAADGVRTLGRALHRIASVVALATAAAKFADGSSLAADMRHVVILLVGRVADAKPCHLNLPFSLSVSSEKVAGADLRLVVQYSSFGALSVLL
jgi:hypothetical protein